MKNAMAMTKGFRALVDEAMAQVQTLSVDEARALLDAPHVQFVDVREIQELARDGVIPNALHAPRGMLEFLVDPDSPYYKPAFAEAKTFVFFCAAGWRSALATKTVQDMGLERVAHIEGGFTAWKAAGAPVAAYEKPTKKA